MTQQAGALATHRSCTVYLQTAEKQRRRAYIIQTKDTPVRQY